MKRALFASVCLLAVNPVDGFGQVCQVPDSVRGMIPAEAPPARPYETLRVTGTRGESVPLGVGHVHYSDQNPAVDLPPGANDWLQGLAFPLSSARDDDPFGWIVEGWILAGGTPVPLSRSSLVETGYEEASFVVFETHPDGWLRLRYDEIDGRVGTAWIPTCALAEGPVLLEFTEWSTWLLRETISPLFFRSGSPGGLRSGPSTEAIELPDIADDYILEPLEVQGEWMRVTVKEPSDYCEFDLESSRREGWVRWHDQARGPRLWYFTRGC